MCILPTHAIKYYFKVLFMNTKYFPRPSTSVRDSFTHLISKLGPPGFKCACDLFYTNDDVLGYDNLSSQSCLINFVNSNLAIKTFTIDFENGLLCR